MKRKQRKELVKKNGMNFNQKRVKVMYFIGMFLFCTLFITACGKEQEEETLSKTKAEQEVQERQSDSMEEIEEEYLTGKYNIEIHVKEKGIIYVELDADSAPITVTNFIDLAKSGFYDGLTFHRVVDGFMIQGGDPQGDGYGGSEKKIKGEFPNNGVDNPLKHTRGAISMARSMIPDSASSQFFIVHQDSPSLDGDYAVFGYVTEGIEVVDDICVTSTGQDFNGVLPAENQPIIESIVVVEE